MLNKKWLIIPILLIFLLMLNINSFSAYYKYTMESGTNFYVSTADKADALETENEKRQILDDLGNLLGHSLRNDLYPKNGDTTGGYLGRLNYGVDASKPAVPVANDMYLATDTMKIYRCFAAGNWFEVYPPRVLGTLGADVNMGNHKLTGLSLPISTGQSVRTTATITEANLEDAITKKHTQNTDTAAGGEWDFGANSAGFTLQTTTGDGTTTIDWRLGNKFKFTFGAQNETFTFTAPTNPCTLMLTLIQDGVGSRTITWPATVKWPGGTEPTLSTAANARDKVALDWDGTQYDGMASLDFK